jgi:hypothetical protein
VVLRPGRFYATLMERDSLPFLFFFAVDLLVDSGEGVTPFFLRFLLIEVRGASGEVDMSMSGSR